MNVAIIGVGLIGGSIGKGLISSNVAERVFGLDTCPGLLERAIEVKAIDEVLVATEHAPIIDLWVLATPPNAAMNWLERLPALVTDQAAVTDVVSVKNAIDRHVPDRMRRCFVGGHPLAGHANSGLEFATGDLFADRLWVLTCGDADPAAVKRVEQMVYALDAKPVVMSPAEHDRTLALVSHLPNILAKVLVAIGDRSGKSHLGGGSWRDLTRVSAGDPKLWAEILLANREEVRTSLAELLQGLHQIDEALEAADVRSLVKLLEPGSAAGRPK